MADLTLKEKCDMILVSIVGPNLATAWWNSPNKAFGGLS